jgi:hypothetical protein
LVAQQRHERLDHADGAVVVGIDEGTDLLLAGHLTGDAGGGVGNDDVHPAVPFGDRIGQGLH